MSSRSPADIDLHHVRTAIDLARSCDVGNRHSWPKVGVVLAGGEPDQIRKATSGSGEHAEFLGLKKMREDGIPTAGATLYTTLEPCAYCQHPNGNGTLSCADMIRVAGIRRIVIGTLHPRPSIRGKAVEQFVKRRIDVRFFPDGPQQEIQDLYERFITTQVPSNVRPRAAVIVSNYAELPFQRNVLHSLLLHLGVRNIDGVVRTQPGAVAPEVDHEQLDVLLLHGQEFRTAVVLPRRFRVGVDRLHQLSEQFDRPLIFVDIDPAPDVPVLPDRITFVGYDNKIGGQKAAAYLGSELGRAAQEYPRVLIIGARQQALRQITFIEALEKQSKGIRHDTEIANFSREDARRVAKERLRVARRDSDDYHAVFATSDDMALGVVDAMMEMAAKGEMTTECMPLVGAYDGGEEVQVHLKNPLSPLRFTIVQNPVDLAEMVMEVVEDETRRPENGRVLLEPGIRVSSARCP
jgi:pyrimidine deaminase RibD-like protein/DNA-binding LacI/PurR family transcriptional regulator